jgi:hypothetical protein
MAFHFDISASLHNFSSFFSFTGVRREPFAQTEDAAGIERTRRLDAGVIIHGPAERFG